MSGKTLLRIGVIVLAVGLLIWFLVGRARVREYDEIIKHGLYRATVANVDDFTAVESKVRPRSVAILIPDDQDQAEPWASIIKYAFRGHMRLTTLGAPADGSLTNAQIADIIRRIESLQHVPVLVIGPHSEQLGKIAAAHRLVIERLPLADVERLAKLPDASPETTQKVCEFAQSYDKALREAQQKVSAMAAMTAATRPAH
jgi:hypothetical protein